jgi:hypothetical protein
VVGRSSKKGGLIDEGAMSISSDCEGVQMREEIVNWFKWFDIGIYVETPETADDFITPDIRTL